MTPVRLSSSKEKARRQIYRRETCVLLAPLASALLAPRRERDEARVILGEPGSRGMETDTVCYATEARNSAGARRSFSFRLEGISRWCARKEKEGGRGELSGYFCSATVAGRKEMEPLGIWQGGNRVGARTRGLRLGCSQQNSEESTKPMFLGFLWSNIGYEKK
ncbi:hypothetical protein FB451DRAFT_1189014 [Mycena latifolia]|nr:hypothetical protein FB451DRAFT_1189014 [Mycena latifolia]